MRFSNKKQDFNTNVTSERKTFFTNQHFSETIQRFLQLLFLNRAHCLLHAFGNRRCFVVVVLVAWVTLWTDYKKLLLFKLVKPFVPMI